MVQVSRQSVPEGSRGVGVGTTVHVQRRRTLRSTRAWRCCTLASSRASQPHDVGALGAGRTRAGGYARRGGSPHPRGAPGNRAGRVLMREGCYRCLEEALGAGAAPRAGDRRVRGRALSTPPCCWRRGIASSGCVPWTICRSPVPWRPPGATTRSRVLLDVVEAMPWPTAASGPAERDAALALCRERSRPAWHEPGTPRFSRRRQPTLPPATCSWSPGASGPPSSPATRLAPGRRRTSRPLLLQFRRIACDRPSLDELLALRKATPRSASSTFGRRIGSERRRAADRRAPLRRRVPAFPSMLPAAHGLARLHVMLEEYEASLPEYDARARGRARPAGLPARQGARAQPARTPRGRGAAARSPDRARHVAGRRRALLARLEPACRWATSTARRPTPSAP